MTILSLVDRGVHAVDSLDPLSTFERLFSLPADNVESIVRDGTAILAESTGASMVCVFHLEASGEFLVPHTPSSVDDLTAPTTLSESRVSVDDVVHLIEVQRSGATYAALPKHNDIAVLGRALGTPGIQSLAATPILVDGGTWGILAAVSGRQDAFTSVELRILEAASRWMGSAVKRAELALIAGEQAKELARRTNAEALVVSVAHDFYNFLTPLTSRIELIRRRAGLEERRRDFQDANRAARSIERLTNMVSDLFDTQRITSGTFLLRREPCDLASLVRETVDSFETGGTKVEVTGLRVLDVLADPKRVRQALENLLANAVKVTLKTGTVRLNLSVQTQTGEPLAVVTIRDEGPGIPPDMMPRLFVRFAAGSDSTGLGLGLYLAQEIARAHGGAITVESTVGEGSLFHLTVPIETAG